jgi:nitrile hydratase accessory protein
MAAGTPSASISGNPILNKPEPEAPFAEAWEAEAFAMVLKLHEQGCFAWGEWSETLGAELKAEPDRPYYESWLAALENIAEKKGLMSAPERLARIDAWDRAARATPHGKPILLENIDS